VASAKFSSKIRFIYNTEPKNKKTSWGWFVTPLTNYAKKRCSIEKQRPFFEKSLQKVT
jgi:hypothetical protein